MQNSNSITIHAGHIGWIVGAVGLFVGVTSLAMIWVTGDSWKASQVQYQSAMDQIEWLRDRVALKEAEAAALAERVAILEAYRNAGQ